MTSANTFSSSVVFDGWESKFHPGRIATGAFNDSYFFSLKLSAIAKHPIIHRANLVREALAGEFLGHLNKFQQVEQTILLKTSADIMNQSFTIPEELAQGAAILQVEEAEHVRMELQLKYQVIQKSGVNIKLPAPLALELFQENAAHLSTDLYMHWCMAFSTVIEMTASKTLAFLHKDETVDSGIRSYILRHATDEGGHLRYFHQLLPAYWAGLEPEIRKMLQELFPNLLVDLLSPDYAYYKQLLEVLGLSKKEIGEIMRDAFQSSLVIRDNRDNAKSVVNSLRSIGAMDGPTRQRFFEKGLIAAGWS